MSTYLNFSISKDEKMIHRLDICQHNILSNFGNVKYGQLTRLNDLSFIDDIKDNIEKYQTSIKCSNDMIKLCMGISCNCQEQMEYIYDSYQSIRECEEEIKFAEEAIIKLKTLWEIGENNHGLFAGIECYLNTDETEVFECIRRLHFM